MHISYLIMFQLLVAMYSRGLNCVYCYVGDTAYDSYSSVDSYLPVYFYLLLQDGFILLCHMYHELCLC